MNNTVIINNLIYDLCNNSSLEKGLTFSDETFKLIKDIKLFNLKNIYLNERLKPSDRYFQIVINEIYNTLKNTYNGDKTLENIRKMNKFYPEVLNEFEKWISNYWSLKRAENLKNDVLFNIENEKEYYKAIIYYIAGMTDNFAINTYNKIIGF